MTFDEYKGLRVLVTGHTGFKGGWLCLWLERLGAEVFGLSLAPESGRPSLFESAGLATRMRSTIGDIRDPATVESAMREAQPDIVLHLAAQPLVRRSYRERVETFGSNVMGTVHVLEAVHACPSVRAVVCVTTDKVYENHEWVWGYRETDRLGGKDPYSASKACAELVAASYQQTMFPLEGRVALATARGGNVVGGGDWSEDRLVPDLVRALRANEPIILRNPGSIRPWQHVLELVRGYLLLGSRLLAGEARAAWNFGPDRGNEVTVEKLVRGFVEAWGKRVRVEIEPSDLREANFLKLDISKADQELGWRPVLDFEETLRLTADWYQRFHEGGERALALTEEQIAAYAARVT